MADVYVGKLPFISDELMVKILIALAAYNGSRSYVILGLNKLFYDKIPFVMANVGDSDNYHVIVVRGGEIME